MTHRLKAAEIQLFESIFHSYKSNTPTHLILGAMKWHYSSRHKTRNNMGLSHVNPTKIQLALQLEQRVEILHSIQVLVSGCARGFDSFFPLLKAVWMER